MSINNILLGMDKIKENLKDDQDSLDQVRNYTVPKPKMDSIDLNVNKKYSVLSEITGMNSAEIGEYIHWIMKEGIQDPMIAEDLSELFLKVKLITNVPNEKYEQYCECIKIGNELRQTQYEYYIERQKEQIKKLEEKISEKSKDVKSKMRVILSLAEHGDCSESVIAIKLISKKERIPFSDLDPFANRNVINFDSLKGMGLNQTLKYLIALSNIRENLE